MNIERPIRIQQHAVYGGTSYGPRQKLLVDAPGSRLIFVPGHSAYISRASGTRYASAALWLVRDDMALRRRCVLHKEGVRLSRKLLASADVQAAVTAEFGEAVAKALVVDATIVLSDEEFKSKSPVDARNTSVSI